MRRTLTEDVQAAPVSRLSLYNVGVAHLPLLSSVYDTLRPIFRSHCRAGYRRAAVARGKRFNTMVQKIKAAAFLRRCSKRWPSVRAPRDIFRKLASTLHLERETDPVEHLRKTTLMQRANVAYTANDLLGLLALRRKVDQINRIDQIDQSELDKLGDDRIKQYNRILGEQLRKIGMKIGALKSALTLDMGILGAGARRWQ